ncbi:YceD family protein [Propionivibrio limicola]|uniref:YceD family protein n=1 Tax=Propionivibrio limicola TaxID=167645 RepID=UPI0012928C01|nr:YceD family protein [Propionivibrio limicola]
MSERMVIDGQAFAREARSLQGELPLAELLRVADMLVNPSGSVTFHIEGRLGPRNRVQLLVQLDGLLSLCCQRCLEEIRYPLRVRSVLEFVESEEELTQEDMEDDSKDFLSNEKELDVVALIEDEIILDLPAAPRHEKCALPVMKSGDEKVSPFAVLKDFKGKAR